MKKTIFSSLPIALKATLRIFAYNKSTKDLRFVSLATFMNHRGMDYIVGVRTQLLNAQEQYAVIPDGENVKAFHVLKEVKIITILPELGLKQYTLAELFVCEWNDEVKLEQALSSYNNLIIPPDFKNSIKVHEKTKKTSESHFAWGIPDDVLKTKIDLLREYPFLELAISETNENWFKLSFQKELILKWDLFLSKGSPVVSEDGKLAGIVLGESTKEDYILVLSVAFIEKEIDTWRAGDKSIKKNSIRTDKGEPESLTIKKKYVEYPVLYGTNRKQIKDSNGMLYFNHERDSALNLGQCHISIPERHIIADIEKPSIFNIFSKDDPEKYFTLLDNTRIEKEAFLKLMSERIGASDENDVLLFIHGYNVTYIDSMFRAAQMGFDLNFKGAVTAFSWPSMGTTSGYVADTDSARLSGTYLKQFIRMILEQNQPKKLHIIAHSMGNVVLSEALLQLYMEGVYPNAAIQQIILAAPDIDQDIFLTQVLPIVKGKSHFTLYASDGDKALKTSRIIRAGMSQRLGEGGDRLVVTEGLDSIDASETDGEFMGHSYFGESPATVTDILNVLSGKLPDKRALKVKEKNGKKYWLLEEDKK
jgi:esterase/lipase superfamily enzyme